MLKPVVAVLGALLVSYVSFAQQQATFDQYMLNGLAINPAYAGSQDALSASFLSRFQNIGLNGAPNTQSLAVHTAVPDKKISFGMLLVHDRLGVIDETGLNGIYAYRITLEHGAKIALGLQAGFSSYHARYSELELAQPDPLFAEDVRQTRPNFGAGIYYNTNVMYAGISVPHLVNNVFDRGKDFRTVAQSFPFIIHGGYVFTLSRMLKLKPNMLFKIVDGRAAELDLNTNLLIDGVLWVGLSYRVSNALTTLVELQITDQFRLGLTYSATLGPISHAEIGSTEILLNYRFRFDMQGLVTPRYF